MCDDENGYDPLRELDHAKWIAEYTINPKDIEYANGKWSDYLRPFESEDD